MIMAHIVDAICTVASRVVRIRGQEELRLFQDLIRPRLRIPRRRRLGARRAKCLGQVIEANHQDRESLRAGGDQIGQKAATG